MLGKALINITPFTDEQWNVVADYITPPISLAKADLMQTFVYSRRWGGVMYVPSGYHDLAMANLYSFEEGCYNHFDLIVKVKKPHVDTYDLADDWLIRSEGAAFKSGAMKNIITVSPKLNAIERNILSKFGDLRVIN